MLEIKLLPANWVRPSCATVTPVMRCPITLDACRIAVQLHLPAPLNDAVLNGHPQHAWPPPRVVKLLNQRFDRLLWLEEHPAEMAVLRDKSLMRWAAILPLAHYKESPTPFQCTI